MDEIPQPVRGRSPGNGWVPITRGIHLPVDRGPLIGWQELLPRHGCVTHLTGAGVRGWWLPPLPEGLPVFVSLGLSDPRPLRRGVHTIRLANPAPYEVIDGVRVASVVEILLACARHLGLIDLVVLIEGAVFSGQVTLAELRSQELPRRKGGPALRAALALADDRSESPWETLLRLLHLLCGIDVVPQHRVLDRDGKFVARGDLWLVGTTDLHEYDGGDHLTRRQQRKDLRRGRQLSSEDWTRRGYTSVEVIHQAVGILRDADQAIGRPHEPERIRVWYDLLRESLFTPAGTRHVLARIGLADAA